MPDARTGRGHREFADRSDIQALASSADAALVQGDYSRCVAIVDDMYDLLDRQSQVPPERGATHTECE